MAWYNCREGKRCKNVFVCKFCGEVWRRNKFKNFCDSYDLNFLNQDFFYYVIKPKKFDSLISNLEKMFFIIEQLRELKKRKKGIFFARLEVSFSRQYGFLPHLNIISFSSELYLNIGNFAIWSRKITKEHEKNAKKIAWYILKFNNIGTEKGLIVQKALNRKSQLIYSTEFKSKNWIDEILQSELDFRFLGVYPIRSKEEIELRKKITEKRKELSKYLKTELRKIKEKELKI